VFQATGFLSYWGHWISSHFKKKERKEKERNMEVLRESSVAELPKVKKKI